MGGTYLPRLNISTRPIENKYREGKLKSTLKRELKVPETAVGKVIGSSKPLHGSTVAGGIRGLWMYSHECTGVHALLLASHSALHVLGPGRPL